MKTSTLSTRWRQQIEINLTKHGLNLILIAVCSILYTSGFAQQKVVNQQELQQKLADVNENIQKIDAAIATINARIVGIPPENLDPSVQVRLNDLQIQKEQYTREKISIEAVLNTSDNSIAPGREEHNSKSTLLSLPNHDQQNCLARADRYVVSENLN